MLRALAAALLLAAVAAGCGGTSTESAALGYAHGFGVKDARVIRVERLRLLMGFVHDVVVMRGRYCPNGPPQNPGKCRETYAVLQLTPGAHKFAGSSIGLAPGTVAIDTARKASPALSVFPDIRDLRVRCRVPQALAAGEIAGVCYSEPRGDGVAFIVGWPLSRPSGARHHGGWLVRLGANGHVLGTKLYRHGPLAAWR